MIYQLFFDFALPLAWNNYNCTFAPVVPVPLVMKIAAD
jgi:hypothetical protein